MYTPSADSGKLVSSSYSTSSRAAASLPSPTVLRFSRNKKETFKRPGTVGKRKKEDDYEGIEGAQDEDSSEEPEVSIGSELIFARREKRKPVRRDARPATTGSTAPFKSRIDIEKLWNVKDSSAESNKKDDSKSGKKFKRKQKM